MEELDPIQLKEELDQFRREKEKIRKLMGQIGGKQEVHQERWLNRFFIIGIFLLFTGDLCQHILHLPWPISSTFSIQLAVLLVSLKIIWMMHKATKVEHFQFWILNAIEFRVNESVRHIRELEKKIDRLITSEENE